jgi:hypothetical protein
MRRWHSGRREHVDRNLIGLAPFFGFTHLATALSQHRCAASDKRLAEIRLPKHALGRHAWPGYSVRWLFFSWRLLSRRPGPPPFSLVSTFRQKIGFVSPKWHSFEIGFVLQNRAELPYLRRDRNRSLLSGSTPPQLFASSPRPKPNPRPSAVFVDELDAGSFKSPLQSCDRRLMRSQKTRHRFQSLYRWQ